jgi:hypothetical protein
MIADLDSSEYTWGAQQLVMKNETSSLARENEDPLTRRENQEKLELRAVNPAALKAGRTPCPGRVYSFQGNLSHLTKTNGFTAEQRKMSDGEEEITTTRNACV